MMPLLLALLLAALVGWLVGELARSRVLRARPPLPPADRPPPVRPIRVPEMRREADRGLAELSRWLRTQ